MKDIIKYYNKGQGEYKITGINDDNYVIFRIEKPKVENYFRAIGFYEWLVNPKYKVFEVFAVYKDYLFWEDEVGMQYVREPKEIIEYLRGVI